MSFSINTSFHKRLFILIFILATTFSVAAQPNYVEDFKKLKTTEERIQKIKDSRVLPIDISIFRSYLPILEKEGDKQAIFYWCYALNNTYSSINLNNEEAFANIKLMKSIANSEAENVIAKLQLAAWNYANKKIDEKEQYSEFLEIFDSMKRIGFDKFKNYDLEHEIYTFGNNFYGIGDYEKALEALKVGEKYKIVEIKSIYYTLNLNLMESIYADQKNYEQAIVYADKIYQVNYSFNPKLDPSHWRSIFWQGLASLNIATYKLRLGKTSEAEALANRGYELTKLNNDYKDNQKNWAEFEALQIFLKIKLSLKKWKDAEMLVAKTEQLMPLLKIESESHLYKFINFYENLAIYYEIKGEYKKALNYLNKSKALKEQKDLRNDKRNLWKIEMRVKAEQYQANLEKVETERNIQQYLSIAIIVLFLIGLAISIITYKRIKLDNKIIENQKKTLELSLRQKETLLREIHHRVKNNLQIINGLLEKQSAKTPSPVYKKLIKESQNRIYSMVLIHQNLYQTENIDEVEIEPYLQMLSKNIQNSHQSKDKKVEFKLDVDAIKMDIDRAIPLGLIINELISNAFKYAFAGRKVGLIEISMKKNENSILLKLKDNGIGLPGDFDINQTNTLGMSLVKGLSRQIDGKLAYTSSKEGSCFELRF